MSLVTLFILIGVVPIVIGAVALLFGLLDRHGDSNHSLGDPLGARDANGDDDDQPTG